ncbi:MAG: heavy metal-binding protein [Capsulimonas sp.]|nr:heavy metal-binding protein [Capsulimonas sp.]
MPFFGLGSRSPGEDAARAAQKQERERVAELAKANREAEIKRQASDLRALAAGGLPIQAIERLKEIGTNEASEILFTSNLAPEEAGLLRREGFHPRGIVTGSAVYHVGQAYASSQGDCEVSVLSTAYNEACRLAVGRMAQELKMIGGHGVVGVRFSLVRHEWADKTIEVQVMGTAVEGPGRPPEQPFMCDLSGQEWYALRRAGYDPVAFVWGHCTWFLLTTQQDEWVHRSWSNVEMTHWSAGLSKARTRAMAHLNKQASAYGANGVAGVKIERRLDEIRLSGPGEDPAYEREHHNIVISILGTAIRARPGAPRHVTPTLNILSLRDGRLTPVSMTTPKDATIE